LQQNFWGWYTGNSTESDLQYCVQENSPVEFWCVVKVNTETNQKRSVVLFLINGSLHKVKCSYIFHHISH
jgi:hypothetical protein